MFCRITPSPQSGSTKCARINVGTMDKSVARGFPDHVTALLESFYSRGLTGWGQKHAATFEDALKATSLSESQLKVSTKAAIASSWGMLYM